MTQQLDALMKTLYEEGVAKAREDAAKILAEAEKESAALREKAEAEAKALRAKTEQECARYRAGAEAELKTLVRDGVATLKNSLSNLVADSVLTEGLHDQLRAPDVLLKLIEAALKAWNPEDGGPDLSVVVPESLEKELRTLLTGALANKLGKGLDLVPRPGMAGGFHLESKDGSFVLRFGEAEFKAYLAPYLAGKLGGLLRDEV